jgi:hypothetical protein
VAKPKEEGDPEEVFGYSKIKRIWNEATTAEAPARDPRSPNEGRTPGEVAPLTLVGQWPGSGGMHALQLLAIKLAVVVLLVVPLALLAYGAGTVGRRVRYGRSSASRE